MDTPDLEALAGKFGIGGYGDQLGHISRDIIISGLLERDRAIESKSNKDTQQNIRSSPRGPDAVDLPVSHETNHSPSQRDGSLKPDSETFRTGGIVLNLTEILDKAIKKVPVVRFALGVAGIVAAVAIIAGYRIDWRVTIFGTVVMVIFMAILFIFPRSRAVKPLLLHTLQ